MSGVIASWKYPSQSVRPSAPLRIAMTTCLMTPHWLHQITTGAIDKAYTNLPKISDKLLHKHLCPKFVLHSWKPNHVWGKSKEQAPRKHSTAFTNHKPWTHDCKPQFVSDKNIPSNLSCCAVTMLSKQPPLHLVFWPHRWCLHHPVPAPQLLYTCQRQYHLPGGTCSSESSCWAMLLYPQKLHLCNVHGDFICIPTKATN